MEIASTLIIDYDLTLLAFFWIFFYELEKEIGHNFRHFTTIN